MRYLLLLLFLASFLLWLEREKNNAWFIHSTSRQPPPNLHNVTSAWPVMLLANQHLPDGNQILAGIMSLLKYVHVQMALPKKCFKMFFFLFVMKYFYLELSYLSWMKNLPVKVCWLCSVLKAVKKFFLSWCTIFHELKSVAKAKIAQNNSQVSEEGITVELHSWIDYLKSEPVRCFCNWFLVSNCIQWSVNFWLQLFSIRWDGKYFNGYNL